MRSNLPNANGWLMGGLIALGFLIISHLVLGGGRSIWDYLLTVLVVCGVCFIVVMAIVGLAWSIARLGQVIQDKKKEPAEPAENN